MPETEDHFACLCEVTRYLIAGDDAEVSNLARQQAFFARHLQPWAERMCDAIESQPQARFYAALAGFTRASSPSRRRASTCSTETGCRRPALLRCTIALRIFPR